VFLLKLLIENIGFPVNIANKKTNEDVVESGRTGGLRFRRKVKSIRYSIIFFMKFADYRPFTWDLFEN
jgi:hypothetical protein